MLFDFLKVLVVRVWNNGAADDDVDRIFFKFNDVCKERDNEVVEVGVGVLIPNPKDCLLL